LLGAITPLRATDHHGRAKQDQLFRLELVYLLFLVQVIAVIWPALYNKVEPSWIGLPFFYWYQLLWVLIGAVLTAIVYFATDVHHR
jgi:uncharacterized membrane protein (DUF4010 family)